MKNQNTKRARAIAQQQYLSGARMPKNGDRGKLSLEVSFGFRDLICIDDRFCGAQLSFDYYNDWLQGLVFDDCDDPAMHIRWNEDGTIAEIIVRDDLMPKIVRECGPRRSGQSEWEKARDGEEK